MFDSRFNLGGWTLFMINYLYPAALINYFVFIFIVCMHI